MKKEVVKVNTSCSDKSISKETLPKGRMWHYLKSINESIKFLIGKQKLTKVDYVFVGADSHRVNYNGKRFNRYFDTLITKYDLSTKSVIYEYGKISGLELENQDKIVKVGELFEYFKSLKKLRKKLKFSKEKLELPDLKGYQEILTYLVKDSLFHDFSRKYSVSKINNLFSTEWEQSFQYYIELLQRNKPKKIFILCYYDFFILSLIVAAKKLNIPTIEVQHGPQPEAHLAYSRWENLPEQGYLMLPDTFWCWDKLSKSNLEKWIVNSKNKNVFIGGNPWIEYWKEKTSEYSSNGFILYGLQPNPVSNEQLFPPKLIDFIKKFPQFKWFLRLHPRQVTEINEIKSFLKEKDVLEMVDIVNATNAPLPLLLANCKLHITHFSGTALEASMMNVHVVLLSPIGELYFKELIREGKAKFIDPNEDSFHELLMDAASHTLKSEEKHINHSVFIKELFN